MNGFTSLGKHAAEFRVTEYLKWNTVYYNTFIDPGISSRGEVRERVYISILSSSNNFFTLPNFSCFFSNPQCDDSDVIWHDQQTQVQSSVPKEKLQEVRNVVLTLAFSAVLKEI